MAQPTQLFLLVFHLSFVFFSPSLTLVLFHLPCLIPPSFSSAIFFPSVSDLPSPSVHHISFSPALTPRHSDILTQKHKLQTLKSDEVTAACVLTVCLAFIGTLTLRDGNWVSC